MIQPINIIKFFRENTVKGPVESHHFFMDKGRTFHPSGLFSEEIFGIEGSKERRETYSWIELNCTTIHPVIYDILTKRIFRNINKLLSGDSYYRIDKETGYLIEDEEGEITGMESFAKNITKIRFAKNEKNPEDDRNKIIDMIYKNIKEGNFFVSKLIVIPPEYRPIMIMEDTDEVVVNPLAELYQKIIIASKQLSTLSGGIYDTLVYRMQLLIRDLYELIKVKVSKKGGLVRSSMLGKRVDFSARSVVSPSIEIPLGSIGLPLRIACQIFEPYMIFGLLNSKESAKVPDQFHIEVKAFLAKEVHSLEEDD